MFTEVGGRGIRENPVGDEKRPWRGFHKGSERVLIFNGDRDADVPEVVGKGGTDIVLTRP